MAIYVGWDIYAFATDENKARYRGAFYLLFHSFKQAKEADKDDIISGQL